MQCIQSPRVCPISPTDTANSTMRFPTVVPVDPMAMQNVILISVIVILIILVVVLSVILTLLACKTKLKQSCFSPPKGRAEVHESSSVSALASESLVAVVVANGIVQFPFCLRIKKPYMVACARIRTTYAHAQSMNTCSYTCTCYMRKPYIKGSNCALFPWNAPDNAQLPYLEAYNALFVL